MNAQRQQVATNHSLKLIFGVAAFYLVIWTFQVCSTFLAKDPIPSERFFFLIIKLVLYSLLFLAMVVITCSARNFSAFDLAGFVFYFLVHISIIIMTFADIYRFHGIYGPDGQLTRNPQDCFYLSVITWTTVGYGDFRPAESARMYAATEAIMGVVFMSFSTACLFFMLVERRRSRGSGSG